MKLIASRLKVFFAVLALSIAAFGNCFASWDDISMWNTGEKEGSTKVKFEQFKGINGDGIKVNIELPDDKHGYVVLKRKMDGKYSPDVPFVFKVKSGVAANLEIKMIDKDGSNFVKFIDMKGKFKDWEQVTVYLDNLDYGWGGDDKFGEFDNFCIGISGKNTKGTVWLDELGLGEKGARSSFPISRKKMEAYYEKAAAAAPLGYFPRWLVKQQSYWTVAGVDYDEQETLVSEEGNIEPFFHAFSVQPFLYIDGSLISYGQVECSQSMEKRYVPVYTVNWKKDALDLEQTIFASGEAGKSGDYVRYVLKNSGGKAVSGKLFLVFRPLQVNPPWQYGGFAEIASIGYGKAEYPEVKINGLTALVSFTEPGGFGAQEFGDSEIIETIRKGRLPGKKEVKDSYSLASGALAYDFSVEAGKTAEYYFYLPIHPESRYDKFAQGESTRAYFDRKLKETAAMWEKRINIAELIVPEPDISDFVKSNIGYILINRDRALIQPGSRNYQRSFVRDGAILSTTLLSLGYTDEVKEYIEFTAKSIRKDGFVPFIMEVDKMPDYVKDWVELDSQGEFVFLVMEYYRYTGDKAFLEKYAPAVKKALEYIVTVRSTRLTPEFKDGPDDKKKFYGLLPESNSHEGYFPGVHSYWDDFWAVKGWKDANEMAKILGDRKMEKWTREQGKDFEKTFYDSMRLVMKIKNLDFIPASADYADFDPTSTSIGISPCGEYKNLPEKVLKDTFKKYYRNTFEPKLNPAWQGSYTPYEQRNIFSFIMMGQKEKALPMMRLFVSHTRPRAWNHLAEVVYSNYREPKYIGDMPHTWIGGEVVNTVRLMLAREKEEKLILAEVIDREWLKAPGGVGVKNLHTHWGILNYIARQTENQIKISVSGTAKPPKGFVFVLPEGIEATQVSINGSLASIKPGNTIEFIQLPSEITVKIRE
ncbi:MAG: hypothetical protein ABII64_10315 [Elusimicrobiota bacterium]